MTIALPLVADATWHRLHPRMLLVHPIVEVGRALPALVGLFIAGRTQGNSLVGLGATGAVVLLSLTRWFTTRLRITPDSVQLRHGLLRRRTVTTSRDRIRTVDVTSHPLHRMLGLARVVIGTGTNDRKGEGRIVLDGLTAGTARWLRDDLLHRTIQPGGRDHTSAVGTELARLHPRWIGYAPFTLSGVLTGLVIWGFYGRIASESGVNFAKSGPLRAVADALRGLPTPLQILIVVIAVLLFVAITSTVGYLLAFWKFRLVRHAGGTVEVRRGLLTTRATSIERRRLVGAAISEPLPLRAVGAARSTAIATGLRTGRGAERGGEVLLPPAPHAIALAVAGEVLDGTPALTVPLSEHGPAARRRRLVRAAVSGGLIAAATTAVWWAGASPWVLVLGGCAVLTALPLGLDRYRNLGSAVADGYLVTAAGSIVRRRAVLDRSAVIGWNLRSSWFQRRAGVVTLTATTAAGRQGYVVRDLAAQHAVPLAELVTPGLLGRFRTALRATSM